MSQENVKIVREMWEALEREDIDRQLELCDEQMEIRNPPEFPVRGPFRGHDGVRQWATEIWEVFTNLHFEVEEIIEAPDGETIVSVQRTQGHMRHTQLWTDVQWAGVWTVRDGKALRAQGYMSRAAALKAAGLRE
jgi:ketosteroid isomerase-like protein